jgi:N-acetylglucosamine-6-phosphate deacetylase
LGLRKGSIKADFDADIIVFDEQINVSDVFVGGEKKI